MTVFIYRNLAKPGLTFSLKDVQTGRVTDRIDVNDRPIIVRRATLKVSKAGRNRVLRERRKNVHAGVQGILIENSSDHMAELIMGTHDYVRVRYNPYLADSFVDDQGNPVSDATFVIIRKSGVYAVKVAA